MVRTERFVCYNVYDVRWNLWNHSSSFRSTVCEVINLEKLLTEPNSRDWKDSFLLFYWTFK